MLEKSNENSENKKKVLKKILKIQLIKIVILISLVLVILSAFILVIYDDDTSDGTTDFEKWLDNDDEMEYDE